MEHTQASPFLKPVSRITPKRKAQISTAPAASSQSVQQRQIEERSELAQAIQRSPDWSNGSLQPAGLFSRAATRGSFSLGSILNASESTTSEAQQEESRIPANDPIQLGLLNSSIASSLFENRIRQESSFLLTAILSAASKAFNPALYKRLRDHAEGILASTFRKGTKSVETAQAVMILTYWKESEDTRAWMLLGYVIRMGMELGWHRLAPYSPQSNAAMDLERRQARNIERTWLILFVYDRSMSLQTGKPWMIERSEFIESIEPWCKDAMATPGDCLLGALVTLRLLSSEVFRLLGPRSSRVRARQLHSLESLLAIIKSRIEEWESRWLRVVDTAQSDPNMTYHMEALWVSYSSALEMLHLICRHSSWLYFTQDSVHVMTAYSAAFLIKLMLSTSHSIAGQIEPAIQSAISGAALVFSQQAAPPGSSCALQSRFLDNILARISKPSAEASTVTDLPEHRDQLRAGERDTTREIGYAATSGRAFGQAEGALSLDFADDETWVGLMAEAGFNTQDGVFFA
ncbi:fungal specific transcription factor domain-containing protein [Colletotrichum paranaense]|uniref:Fungal specific transcription factor domain-containing protein n=1 Tax=Colletotrichum paranaense TaxID=1914294 RepID=A0ABQ9SIC4_9PEZI|nr:fungal specific transcription factor domain-containing protein [Colletotrichum paranaense]KAK1537536.1 fungal specific transcription factor domain-containing protein [Colletotrichum paranaense]